MPTPFWAAGAVLAWVRFQSIAQRWKALLLLLVENSLLYLPSKAAARISSKQKVVECQSNRQVCSVSYSSNSGFASQLQGARCHWNGTDLGFGLEWSAEGFLTLCCPWGVWQTEQAKLCYTQFWHRYSDPSIYLVVAQTWSLKWRSEAVKMSFSVLGWSWLAVDTNDFLKTVIICSLTCPISCDGSAN